MEKLSLKELAKKALAGEPPIKLFRRQEKFIRFGDFITELQKAKCSFCKTSCGASWCPAIKEEK